MHTALLISTLAVAMAGIRPESNEQTDEGRGPLYNNQEALCTTMEAMIGARTISGASIVTEQECVASPGQLRGLPLHIMQEQPSGSASSSPLQIPSVDPQYSTSCRAEDRESKSEDSTPVRLNRDRSRTPPGAPRPKPRTSRTMASATSPQDQLYAALRSQIPSLSAEELQSAFEVAYALRSTLEAAGHSHEEIVEGAEQVTNALIVQWVAEDLNQNSIQNRESADEAQEEEACEDDVELSSLAGDSPGE